VDINPSREFEMVPKVGNHIVVFGNGEEIADKFRKLFIFYNDVLNKTGWNKYSAVNLSYKNQVVATRKDMKSIRSDTLLARQWVKQMIKNTKDQALADSARKKAIADGIAAAIANDVSAKPAAPAAKNAPAKTSGTSATGNETVVPVKAEGQVKKPAPVSVPAAENQIPAAKPADKRKPKAVLQPADDHKKVTTTSIKEQL
jgi:cell division protein FtsQ